eukprot:CAMPEP_0181299900 /NCGR_PEP_ID=MMETSP1101-20121128/6597_1 /TAXON_ID=46948 /ORGANISM="Rhodomonas abbreviata, Strain Caron Lab Isolate" /LENGTH=60 /DNA_ID=CAMNT_0023405089 /DNA_START=146 /DNA_END=328 /DNA_ORIENTATION=+
MPFVVPIMLLAGFVPIAGLVWLQMEHDTRGFTEIPSETEGVAEAKRRKRALEEGANVPDY